MLMAKNNKYNYNDTRRYVYKDNTEQVEKQNLVQGNSVSFKLIKSIFLITIILAAKDSASPKLGYFFTII